MRPDGGDGRPGSGFGRLIARLHADPVRADAEFGRLRRTLVKFFDWRGAFSPEDCADETIDRLARKLEEEVAVLDVFAFARGIARLVLQEAARTQERTTSLDDERVGGTSAVATPVHEDHPLAGQLEACLDALPREARELVLAYYGGGGGRGKIDGRQRLARDLRLTENALRSRVQRLRDQLEDCVRSRMTTSLPRLEGRK